MGMATVEVMSGSSQSGPPLGGQLPSATLSPRALLRASRLVYGQICVRRGEPSMP